MVVTLRFLAALGMTKRRGVIPSAARDLGLALSGITRA